MSNECYSDYVPWKKRINANEIINYITSLGNDEGLRIKIEGLDGKKVKIYVNKTGLEYVLGIVYDDGKEENLIFSNVYEMYQSLCKLIDGKKVLDIISY